MQQCNNATQPPVMYLTTLKRPSRPPPPPPIHRRGDYIPISECHTGPPKPNNLKFRSSISFSSPKPSTFNHYSHQKSRSLTEGAAAYTYLDVSTTSPQRKTPPVTEYNRVDFTKTVALNQCKDKRTKTNMRQTIR